MNRLPLYALLSCWVFASGCVQESVPDFEESEIYPGGETTNTFMRGIWAYSRENENTNAEESRQFGVGNSFFTNPWVGGEASTTARDGLGPLFNARACTGCHEKDGRGQPTLDSDTVGGLLIRLSVDVADETGAPIPHPFYGGQLQTHATDDDLIEGRFTRTEMDRVVTYPDGTDVTLKEPAYDFEFFDEAVDMSELHFSPRVAPAVIGLGLLENIPESRLEELEDEDDTDEDGISGKISRVIHEGVERIGRFGWKAEQADLKHQNAAAANGDMGLTSMLQPEQHCSELQEQCLEAAGDDDRELEDEIFQKMYAYTALLAVPVRVNGEEEDVMKGRTLFYEMKCHSCHTPSHQTGSTHEFPSLENQKIWPYTDLLLHDMGEDLADRRQTWNATGTEWRTPPLWGLSALEGVNDHMRLMHDGRADGVEEAILWHGGEAIQSRLDFMELEAAEREQLIQFVESL